VKDKVTELAKREYESSTEQEQELPIMNNEDVPF